MLNYRPKAYEPERGYKYQIFRRNQSFDRTWEHCDYAKDRDEMKRLIKKHKLACGTGWEVEFTILPFQYHPKTQVDLIAQDLSNVYKRLEAYCNHAGEDKETLKAYFDKLVDPYNTELPKEYYNLYIKAIDNFLRENNF